MGRSTLKKLVVIGTSAGGFNALKTIFSTLPKDFPVPVLVVQHILPKADSKLISLMADTCQLNVKFADNGEKISAGTVYFAPPDYHMRIQHDDVLMLSTDEKINSSRPSIDALFLSASNLKHYHIISVILTGASADGTAGAKAIKQQGGTVIAQQLNTAESTIMPSSVIDNVDVDHVIWLDQIGPVLWDLCQKS